MGNSQGVLGDPAIADEHCNRFGIPLARRAQDEALGRQSGSGRVLAACAEIPSSKVIVRAPRNEQGAGTRLPAKNPIGSAGSMGYRRTYV